MKLIVRLVIIHFLRYDVPNGRRSTLNNNQVILHKIDQLLDEITTDFDYYIHQQTLNRGADSIRTSLQMAHVARNEMIFLITLLNLINEQQAKVNLLSSHFFLSKSQLQNEAAKFSRFVTTTDDYHQTLVETSKMQHFLTNKALMESSEMYKQIIIDDLLAELNSPTSKRG